MNRRVIAALVAVAGVLVAAPVRAGLLFHYTFDASTVSGTTVTNVANPGIRDGVLVDAQTTEAGRLGEALRFDGVNDFMSIAYDAGLALGTAPFTASLWILPANLDTAGLLNRRTGSANREFEMRMQGQVANDGKLFFQANDGVSNGVISPSSVSTEGWNHVAFRRSGSTMDMFVNGLKVGTDTDASAQSVDATNQPFVVGTIAQAPGSDLFEGLMDDLRLYNEALSDIQIAALASGSAVPEPGAAALVVLAVGVAARGSRPKR